MLLILLTLVLFTSSCSNDKREEVLDRYPSGAKYIVGIYQGEGSNEKFIKREFYQESGKLGKVENMIEGTTITYLDLYPNTSLSNGLRNFLEGRWYKTKRIDHHDFDIYETYSMWFDNSLERYDNYKLEKSVNISVCDDYKKLHDISISINSDIEYLDDLYLTESNLSFFGSRPTYEGWGNFMNHYNLNPSDFNFTTFAELSKYGNKVDQSNFLGQWATLNVIFVRTNSIGESFSPVHGLEVEDSEESLYYILEKRTGPILVREMNKGVMPRSCEELKSYFM